VSQGESHDEPVTITDKRRIDPETGEVRDGAEASTPSGSAPGAAGVEDGAEAAELKATLQRVKAEYDNFRKRTEREKQSAAERGKAAAAMQLLPVLDDLDRARSHGDLESGPLKSVADKLAAALQNMGLVAFGVEGDPFDPSLHEAVQHEGDGGEGSRPVIGTVMRQGYRLGENVLRHALVGVVDTVAGDETATAGEPAQGAAQSGQADSDDNADAPGE
jgi:molecular chaperone GrpE